MKEQHLVLYSPGNDDFIIRTAEEFRTMPGGDYRPMSASNTDREAQWELYRLLGRRRLLITADKFHRTTARGVRPEQAYVIMYSVQADSFHLELGGPGHAFSVAPGEWRVMRVADTLADAATFLQELTDARNETESVEEFLELVGMGLTYIKK